MIPVLLPIVIAYVAGVAVADIFRIAGTGYFVSALLVFAGVALCLVLVRKYPAASLVSSVILFLLLGFILASTTAIRLESGLIHKAAKSAPFVTIEGTVITDPKSNGGISIFVVSVETLRLDDKDWMVKDKLEVKVRSDNDMRLHYGEHIRVSGRLSIPESGDDFDYRRYLFHKGITSQLWASACDIRAIDSGGLSPVLLVGIVREWIKGTNTTNLPPDCAGLLTGVVLGDISAVNGRLSESFSITGLTHILAASGMNIALIIGALWPLLRLLGVRALSQVLILIAFAAVYTLLSGLAPSISRAFIMASIGLIAWLSGRDKDNIATLCAAALILLIIDPFTLYDIGFQLSFAATFALIAFAPIIEDGLGNVPVFLRSPLAVILAAQAGVLPLVLYYFGQISTISIAANLIVSPLASITLILGMIALPVAALSSLLAKSVYLVLAVILKTMIFTTQVLANTPGASIVVPQRSTVMLILSLIAVLAAVFIVVKLRVKLGFRHTVIILVLIPTVSIWWHVGKAMAPAQLEVVFMDVGQGDAALLTAPDGTRLLIDAGPSPNSVKRLLEEMGVKKLDAVILSHEHADHVAGLPKLLDAVTIGSLMYPDGTETSSECSEIIAEARKKKIKCIQIYDGAEYRLGEYLKIEAFCAPSETGNDNEESAVVKVSYGKFSLLFTGDAGDVTERRLVDSGRDLDVDILKVGHHGSAVSSTRDFLLKTTPDVSVISVGKGNAYGHPVASAIGRLSSVGSEIYRTDKHGDVTIKSDGDTYRVYIEKGK